MITEKTSTPMGSSRLRPTGYWYESDLSIIFAVVQTIAVDRKSKAASTKLANTDRELVRTMTAILPARRTELAAKLT